MYTTVTSEDQLVIRAERLRALECDHLRCALLLEEEPSNGQIKRDLVDLKRRIDLHRHYLDNSTKVDKEGEEGAA